MSVLYKRAAERHFIFEAISKRTIMAQRKILLLGYNITLLLILLFAAAHILYTFLLFTGDAESQLWFFSASLGMLGSAWFHYLYIKIGDARIKRAAVGITLLMLGFCIILYTILPEMQVLLLCFVYVAALFFAIGKK